MITETLRELVPFEEFDYQTLVNALSHYARPRNKISDLLRLQHIIRVKKGLYIFGPKYRKEPYSREVLANLIYGPSYISLEYALAYYGLIPECVETVTSISSGRSKRFLTPIGLFTYNNVSLPSFQIAVNRIETDNSRSFLIALPEKALADKIRFERSGGLSTQKQLRDYLCESLRIEANDLRQLDTDLLRSIAGLYRSRRIKLLSDLIRRL